MMTASAPTLLAVALAAELHGRAAVGLSAAAFTVGSLLAPALAGLVERTRRNELAVWLLLATGMIAGWTMAAQSLGWLCVAQVSSGLCMTSLEGLLDTRASRERPHAVTAALARATAARAVGSSAGTVLLPILVASAGLFGTTTAITVALATLALVIALTSGLRQRGPSFEAMTPPAGSPFTTGYDSTRSTQAA
jgi:hypothetical protein